MLSRLMVYLCRFLGCWSNVKSVEPKLDESIKVRDFSIRLSGNFLIRSGDLREMIGKEVFDYLLRKGYIRVYRDGDEIFWILAV